MAVDMFQIGTLGLRVAHKKLSTVSHNIANVGTDGFSRQEVNQVTSRELFSGGNYLGTGVVVADVRRAYLSFAYFNLISSQTQLSYAKTFTESLISTDDLLGSIGRQSVIGGISGLFESLNAVVDTPGEVGKRDIFLEKVKSSAQGFNAAYRDISTSYLLVNDDITQLASEVTSLGARIADLNGEIVNATGPGRTDPNDLLDKRDLLLLKLSEIVSVNTIEDDTGSVTVMIGGTVPLVTGNTSFSMGVQPGDLDPAQEQLYLATPGRDDLDRIKITGRNMGGEMAALFEFRDDVLGNALDRMGLSALALADAFNSAQAEGLDLNENIGRDLFNDINRDIVRANRVFSDADNTGSQVLDVTVSATSLLTASEFELEYIGGNQYQITDLSDGVTEIVSANTASELVMTTSNFGGITINLVSGAVVSGDTFLIQPSRYAANELGVVIEKPELIAASSIVEVNPSDDNVSSAILSLVSVSNPSDANFPTDGSPLLVTALQNTAGTYEYSVYAGSTLGTALAISLPLTPPQDITIAGVTFRIEGQPIGEAPNAPERYTIDYAFGPGNNNNAIQMSKIQTQNLIFGDINILDNFENLITHVGSLTQNAARFYEANEASFDQAFERYEGITGVHLDEEAANLLQYQQAYIAATRVITTARAIIDSLLEAVG